MVSTDQYWSNISLVRPHPALHPPLLRPAQSGHHPQCLWNLSGTLREAQGRKDTENIWQTFLSNFIFQTFGNFYIFFSLFSAVTTLSCWSLSIVWPTLWSTWLQLTSSERLYTKLFLRGPSSPQCYPSSPRLKTRVKYILRSCQFNVLLYRSNYL